MTRGPRQASLLNTKPASPRSSGRWVSSRWSWILQKNTADVDRGRQRKILRDQRPLGCSVRRGCKAMNLPRSTYYYRSARTLELTDGELTAIIEDVQDELPCYGYRRVTHELRRRGFAINHKRVARVMRVAGLGIKPASALCVRPTAGMTLQSFQPVSQPHSRSL